MTINQGNNINNNNNNNNNNTILKNARKLSDLPSNQGPDHEVLYRYREEA